MTEQPEKNKKEVLSSFEGDNFIPYLYQLLWKKSADFGNRNKINKLSYEVLHSRYSHF